jgi:hypothetical protein
MSRVLRLFLLAVFVLLVCGWTEYWRAGLVPRLQAAHVGSSLFPFAALAVFVVPLLVGCALVLRFHANTAVPDELRPRPPQRVGQADWSPLGVAAAIIARAVRLLLLAIPVSLVVAWTMYWRLDVFPRVQHAHIATSMLSAVAFGIFVTPPALGAFAVFLAVRFLQWRYVVEETRRIDDVLAPLRAAGLRERNSREFDSVLRAAVADELLVRTDATGSLYRAVGTHLALLLVENSTPEPDGSFKRYILRVPPNLSSPISAVAWTFGLTVREYAPAHES